jgi:hypothetical protein
MCLNPLSSLVSLILNEKSQSKLRIQTSARIERPESFRMALGRRENDGQEEKDRLGTLDWLNLCEKTGHTTESTQSAAGRSSTVRRQRTR